MTMCKKMFFAVVVFVLGTQAQPAKLSFNSSLRLRFEHQDGYNYKYFGNNPKAGDRKDSFGLSRLRAGILYTYSDRVNFALSFQDSRAYDWSLPDREFYTNYFSVENNPQKDYLEIHELFLLTGSKDQKQLLKIGRQLIAIDDERLFAEAGWKNTGKWLWDGISITKKFETTTLTIFSGATVLTNPQSMSLAHRYGYLGGGVYGQINLSPWLIVEPVLAYKINNDGEDVYKAENNYYVGAGIISDAKKRFAYKIRGVLRAGNQIDTFDTEKTIRGYGLEVTGIYSARLSSTPSFNTFNASLSC